MSDRDRKVAPKTRGADDRGVLLGVAVLWLILPTQTEPPSSAMTNASTFRSIEIAPKKPTRHSRAKAEFMRAEAELDAYYRMGVSLDQSSMLAKVKAAEAIADQYRRTIARGDPEYSLASWVRIAEVYLHFAEEIRRAPHPDRSELEAMALGPERLAREALDRGRDHAQSHRVRGVWKARLDRLQRR